MQKENHRRARMMSSDSAMASIFVKHPIKIEKSQKILLTNSIHHILNMWLLLESDKEKNKPMNKNFVKYLPFCKSIYKSISSWIHSFHFIFYSLFIHLFKMFLNFEYNIQGGESEDDLYLPVHEIVWLKPFPLRHVTITTSTEYQKRNFPSLKKFRKIMI